MKFAFITLGCKTNQLETAAMEQACTERGHELVEHGADVYIINTCTVTGTGGKKSRAAIRQARRESPAAVVAVCGCHSQMCPDEAVDAGADIVFGTSGRMKMLDEAEKLAKERIEDNAAQSAPSVAVSPAPRSIEVMPACVVDGRTRALIKVEDGCDNFCAYCVIPYARGRVRSLPIDEAVRQMKKLACDGCREAVVTGIEISSYGKDTGESLTELISALCSAAPGVRVRLGSLEPRTVTEEFCRALSGFDNLCPHFHLSLQSGCDATLSRMRRRYDTARFYESVSMLREYFTDCGLTTDLITGFPGETDAEFEETLAFIEKCAFSGMHIFPYSERKGTVASSMAGKVPRTVKEERAALAAVSAGRMKARFLESMIGKTLSVLFETEKDGIWQGHSGNYCVVNAESEQYMRNAVVPVRITGISDGALLGQIVL